MEFNETDKYDVLPLQPELPGLGILIAETFSAGKAKEYLLNGEREVIIYLCICPVSIPLFAVKIPTVVLELIKRYSEQSLAGVDYLSTSPQKWEHGVKIWDSSPWMRGGPTGEHHIPFKAI